MLSLLKLSRAEPDLEFEGLLKRQHTRVKYFQGSLMSAIDLERSKVTALIWSQLTLCERSPLNYLGLTAKTNNVYHYWSKKGLTYPLSVFDNLTSTHQMKLSINLSKCVKENHPLLLIKSQCSSECFAFWTYFCSTQRKLNVFKLEFFDSFIDFPTIQLFAYLYSNHAQCSC